MYARDVSTAESIAHWKADWIGCLGENARVQMLTYGVILSNTTVTDTQMENQAWSKVRRVEQLAKGFVARLPELESSR